MGRREKRKYKLNTEKEKIPRHIINSISHIRPRTSSNRRYPLHELRDSEGRVAINRKIYMYIGNHIYKMLCEIIGTESNNSTGIYLSHLEIYKYCKNLINSENAIVSTVSDAKYINLGRIPLFKEITCYLFSLINEDTLNFDENGDFINEFVKNNIEKISEWEYELRTSLMLDGFFQAIDDLIIDACSNYSYRLSEECNFNEELECKLIQSSKRKNDDFNLLKLLSFSVSFFDKYFMNIKYNYENIKFSRLITPKVFTSDSNESKHITKLPDTYSKFVKELKNWRKQDKFEYNKQLSEEDLNKQELFNRFKELFCLYHINRVTHIIDMKSITNYHSKSIPIHRFEGLFTPIIMNKIFKENDRIVENTPSTYSAMKDHKTSHSVYCYSVNENLSIRNISERDIVFIKHIIDSIAHTFNETFLIKESKDDIIHNYKKAYDFFVDFSTQDTANDFLDKCNFIELINALDENPIDILYYRRIYEDLTTTAKDD